MRRLSQWDPRWYRVTMGNSNVRLGPEGCLVTSICMISSKLYPKAKIDPNEAAKQWKFTDSSYPYGAGLLLWTESKFKGMNFVERVTSWGPQAKEHVRELLEEDGYGVCIEVQTRKGGRHWVACVGPSIWGWATNDPWTGKRLYKTVGVGTPYKRILGYCVFRKK